MIRDSRIYTEVFWKGKIHKPAFGKTGDVIVEENTSFAAAKKYLMFGKVAVLNFANPENPGGGVQNGAMAQEECLCRSSNLYEALICKDLFDGYYRYHRELKSEFYSDRLIYSPGITVFKNDSDIPEMLPKEDWFKVDVITCAAPYLGRRKYTNKAALKELFKTRIKNIFEVAIDNNVYCLILGAFGCGAFKNPPEVVASAFHEVIQENNYAEKFKFIVFAIKRNSADVQFGLPSQNLAAFELEFNGKSKEAERIANMPNPEDDYVLGYMSPKVLPSGRVINQTQEWDRITEWKKGNKYYGKQFSILGDSISTLEGYNPKGYNLFYTDENCIKAGVFDSVDTWWGKAIDYFGGELLVNNSWSGSRVTRLPNSEKLFPSGCSYERTNGLHIGSVLPDVIIVYLGTNDWAQKVRSGDFDTIVLCEEEYERFDTAYELMIKKLKVRYPDAEIWCCTLNTTFMPSNPAFKFPHSYAGTHIEKFNEIIRQICKKTCGLKLIDLYSFHLPYASIDGSHPDSCGMSTLATMMIRSIADEDGAYFLNCADGDHLFKSVKEYTGGSEYVCSKCALRKSTNTLFVPNDTDKCVNMPKRIIEDFIDFDPEATAFIYAAEDGVRLYSESRKTEFTIKKQDFTIGRSSSCDLHFDLSSPGANYIARMHARMMFDYDRWLISDTHSTNGTWLNGHKLESGKWYVLHYDDVINFAHQEKYVFFKTNSTSIYGNEADKASAILAAAMKVFHESNHKDETAFKLIVSALIDAPLYVPVEIDLQAMLGDIDPTKLKPGDSISPKSDVRMKIRTIDVNGTEFVPLFSSSEEAKKGPSSSVACMAPQDYLPEIIQMGKDAVINPFGGNAFIYNQKIITELVMPIVQSKNNTKVKESIKPEDLSGRTIGDKYLLKEIIGRGGFFVTYLAVDKNGLKLSVKVCDKTASGYNSETRNLILQEPRMMMQFNHPNMPKVLDIIEDERYIYIVRPFIEGRDLRAVIEEKGHLEEDEAVRIAICVASALDCIHKATPGFVFRDVKPQNILITNKGEVILFDFGAAVEIKSGSTPVSIGTRGYAAPEQYTSNFDQRVDIFGLGATLHYMLTGHNPSEPPYELQSITHYYADLSKGLEYVVDRCLKKARKTDIKIVAH